MDAARGFISALTEQSRLEMVNARLRPRATPSGREGIAGCDRGWTSFGGQERGW